MLRCEDCDATAEGEARGWRACLGRENKDDAAEVVLLCPSCAEREFGRSVHLSCTEDQPYIPAKKRAAGEPAMGRR